MVPGADEVLALKVHASVRPPFAISHVSVSVGPLTPNRAVAALGFAMVTVIDADVPAYEAVIVAEAPPAPAFVENPNVALVAPEGTATVDGRTNPSPPVS